MYLKPCRHCPHSNPGPKDCDLKLARLEAVCGLGLTSINWYCPRRLSTLPPGKRVSLVVGNIEEDDFEIDETEDTYTATVMRPYKGRIQVWLDGREPWQKNPIAVRPNGLTPLNEPLVEICRECYQPKGTLPTERFGGCQTCLPYEDPKP